MFTIIAIVTVKKKKKTVKETVTINFFIFFFIEYNKKNYIDLHPRMHSFQNSFATQMECKFRFYSQFIFIHCYHILFKIYLLIISLWIENMCAYSAVVF